MKNHISFRVRMGYCLLTFSIITFGIILGGNYYQLIAEIYNWFNNLIDSSVSYNGYFKISQSGYFFQKIVSLTILCLSVATILLWSTSKAVKKWLLVALSAIFISEVFTVLFLIPENFTVFLNPFNEISVEQLEQIGTKFQQANHFRLLMVTLTMVAFLKAEELLVLSFKKAPKLKEEVVALS
jgi:Domain of unknown function (DUF1772)